MIEEALRRAGADENIDKMLAEFLVHYEANIAVESPPSPRRCFARNVGHGWSKARGLHQQA